MDRSRLSRGHKRCEHLWRRNGGVLNGDGRKMGRRRGLARICGDRCRHGHRMRWLNECGRLLLNRLSSNRIRGNFGDYGSCRGVLRARRLLDSVWVGEDIVERIIEREVHLLHRPLLESAPSSLLARLLLDEMWVSAEGSLHWPKNDCRWTFGAVPIFGHQTTIPVYRRPRYGNSFHLRN